MPVIRRRYRPGSRLSYEEARARARAILPRALFDYVDGGANDEVTLARNVQAFRDQVLIPRGGVWTPSVELRTTVLGQELSLPVLTAPCGGMRVVHPDGDLAVARAAAAAGTIHIATSASGFTLEEIAEPAGPRWFQLYRLSGRPMMENLVQRARDSGYQALVVTIDTVVSGNRERDYRNGFSLAMKPDARTAWRMGPQLLVRPGWTYRFWRDGMPFVLANAAGATSSPPMHLAQLAAAQRESMSPTWDDLEWIRANWAGPLVVKGVMRSTPPGALWTRAPRRSWSPTTAVDSSTELPRQ